MSGNAVPAEPEAIPLIQRIISILWPSFLTSGVATVLFFASFDPVGLLADTRFAGMSRLGAYSVGFFLFWMLTTLTSALTCYFQRPCPRPRD